MAKIHLIVGYMGFGKTTLAHKLAKDYNGVVLSHDAFMHDLFGRNLADEQFRHYQDRVTDLIWRLCGENIKTGTDVVIDASFWSRERRREAFLQSKKFTDDIVFYQLESDMDVAKQRVLKRTETNPEALFVDENCFNKFLELYEPINPDEGYNYLTISGC